MITRVRLRLISLFTDLVTVLLALQDTAAALRVLALVRGRVPSLDSAGITYADGLELVHKHLRLLAPFRTRASYPVHLLLECAAQRDPRRPDRGPGAQPRLAGLRHRHRRVGPARPVGVPRGPYRRRQRRRRAAEAGRRGPAGRAGELRAGGARADGPPRARGPAGALRPPRGGRLPRQHPRRRGQRRSVERCRAAGRGPPGRHHLRRTRNRDRQGTVAALTRAAVDLDPAAVTKRAWSPDALLHPGVLSSTDPA